MDRNVWSFVIGVQGEGLLLSRLGWPGRASVLHSRFPTVVFLLGLFFTNPMMAGVMLQADEPPPLSTATNHKSAVPEEMRAILTENVETFATCDLRFTSDYKFSTSPPGRPIKKEHEFYMEGGKFRHRMISYFPGVDALVSTVEEAFDGRVFYQGGWSGDSPPGLRMYLGDNHNDIQTKHIGGTPIFLLSLGVELPNTISGLNSFSLTSVLLRMIDEAESLSIEDGEDSLMKLTLQIPEPTVVRAKSLNLEEFESLNLGSSKDYTNLLVKRYRELRSTNLMRKVELWLDPAKGYALKRRVDSTLDEKRIQTIECENFEFSGRGQLWLPRTSTIRTFLSMPAFLKGFKEEAEQTDTVTLQNFSFDHRSDVSFAISYGPGTMIADRSTAAAAAAPIGEVSYIVPADVNALREAANRAQPRVSLLLIINIIVLVVVAGVVVWRWRASR